MTRLSALLLLALAAGPAGASCGASVCHMEDSGPEPRARRSVELGYEYEYIPQDRRWNGRRSAPEGVRGGHHDEEFSYTSLHRLRAAAGLTRRWSVALQAPLVQRAHGHIHYHKGAQHKDRWQISGLGDLMAEVRYAFWSSPGGSTWSLAGGLELPTGRRSVRNAAGAEAEAGVLPGSGTWDRSVSLLWQRPLARGGLFASAARRDNGRGEQDYRVGSVNMLHAGFSAPLGRGVSMMAQLNAVRQERDRKGGTREDTSNTGGEALFLTPGVAVAFGDWTLSATLQVPLYQRVNGYQIVAGYGLRTGISRRLAF